MKKIALLALLIGTMPLSMQAQDDMYLIPSKSKKVANSFVVTKDSEVTYSGSDRDVDEYNRHGKFWSHYQKIGSDNRGNDIIEFQKGRGIYPDSTYIDTTFVGQYYDTMIDDDDYRYTQRMSRWDGYYDPWFYTSRHWRSYPYWRAGWGWYNPWYYGYAGYYDPWYDPWYAGYGYPYAYGYYGYGWGSPYYYSRYYGWAGYPVRYVYRTGHTGTLTYYDRSNFRPYYGRGYDSPNRNRRYGRDVRRYDNQYNSSGNTVTFGSRRPSPRYDSPTNSGRRNTTPTFQGPTRTPSGSFGSGSFGGGTSPRGSSGGFHGGGSFGGGRR